MLLPSLLLVSSFISTAGARGWRSKLEVETSNGIIEGHKSQNRSNVAEFLGIPYADPPVGQLRFAPPKVYTGKRAYVAAKFGFRCPQSSRPPYELSFLYPHAQQIIDDFTGTSGNRQDEDCLTLNIWTKSIQNHKPERRPVLVYFFGGRFAAGATSTPFYSGQYLSDAQDVVVVTVNYRLNIFGFPGAPSHADNLGLRDQRVAVEWIHDNIGGFGGNPSLITIWGQSSGGVAVDYWAYAYKDEPIVKGLISDSGNAFSFPMNPENVTIVNWYNVSAELGCSSDGDTVPCMRSQRWEDIENAASKVPSASGGSPIRSVPPFWPKPDGQIVFENYTRLAEAGAFARLPYLLGNNHHEQGYYILPALAANVTVTKAQQDNFLLSSFTCPNMFEAKKRRHFGVPVWQYRYFGHWDNIRLYNGSGAYHGTELEMIFGNDDNVSGLPSSAAEDRMTDLMQEAWAAFAADPECGLSRLGWPQYNPDKKSLVTLAKDNRPVVKFMKPSDYDAACSTVELGAYNT